MDFESKYDRRPASRIVLAREPLEAFAGRINPSALQAVTELAGGFSSTNLRLDFADGERCVLRLARGATRLETEADLLAFVAREIPDVPIPQVLWRAESDGDIAACAMTFVEGDLLSVAEDGLAEAACRDLCEQLAQAAARIHSVRFATPGFLGSGVKVVQPFGDRPFMESCLADKRVQTRLGPQRLARLVQCLARQPEAPPRAQLCHADFNQKNMLVRRDATGRNRLAAVLDWEFACSASAAMDIGNFLRFAAESPVANEQWFAAAYRAAGGHLDADWRTQSLIADLSAQCSFLMSEETLPKTFATALGVIDSTLTRIGG